MGLTSLQVCMDTSEWLQGVVHEERRMDSSPPSGGDMITCSRPLLERRLRPQHDQALKCPRCDSTHTKFCYYNNYSLSQPRYFCKTCRRYWTKGGSLRNIPVGGGCRKNKRVVGNNGKKSTDQPLNHHHHQHHHPSSSSHDATHLQLSFPHEGQLSHLNNLLGSPGNLGNPNLMETKYNEMLEINQRQVDFMENKFDIMLGSNPRNHDFLGNSDLGLVGGLGNGFTPSNFHGVCSSFGMSLDGNNGALMLPFEGSGDDPNAMEMKQNNRMMLSLDQWQDHQGCSEVGKDSFGYLNGLGSWTGVMNGYGSSATNQLV